MFSETKSQETSGLSRSDIKCILSGFMRVLAPFNIVRTHWILNWNSLILDWDSWVFMRWVPGLTIQGSKLKKKYEVAFLRPVNRGFISIGDRRIVRLLHIILWLNFNEVWPFFIQTNQTWICYANVKRNYSQKCVLLAISHLLYIPK